MSNTEFKEEKKQFALNKKWMLFIILLAVAVTLSFFGVFAEAYEVPAANDPGYDFYDLVVKKGLEGPIGFSLGVFLLINAGTSIGQNPKMAALQALGGGVLIKAEAVATTLGWIV